MFCLPQELGTQLGHTALAHVISGNLAFACLRTLDLQGDLAAQECSPADQLPDQLDWNSIVHILKDVL